MTPADALASYVAQIGENGQFVAIRRYKGIGPTRTYTDTVTKAYVRNYSSSELIGAIVQGDQKAITLVDGLAGILPVLTTDALLVGFELVDGAPRIVEGHVVGGGEFSIKNPMKRVVGGVLVALEIHAKG
jgi:hypothetical protein